VVERRLLRVIRRRRRNEPELPGPAGREGRPLRGAELTLATKQVDDQPAGEEAADHPQDRR
jgi:hypothetical protein